mmetsp:Transcript_152519/g.489123  ORF Transcript_152519/g.489123 Transcript_152519/m.489123 type:complete len:253 (-) Transcript_152519:3-761(-)
MQSIPARHEGYAESPSEGAIEGVRRLSQVRGRPRAGEASARKAHKGHWPRRKSGGRLQKRLRRLQRLGLLGGPSGLRRSDGGDSNVRRERLLVLPLLLLPAGGRRGPGADGGGSGLAPRVPVVEVIHLFTRRRRRDGPRGPRRRRRNGGRGFRGGALAASTSRRGRGAGAAGLLRGREAPLGALGFGSSPPNAPRSRGKADSPAAQERSLQVERDPLVRPPQCRCLCFLLHAGHGGATQRTALPTRISTSKS